MLPLLLLALTLDVRTGFEGGSLGKVEPVSASHVRCTLAGDKDQDGRNRQANWYYFRVEGAPREVTIDLVGLPGEYNYRPNRGAVSGETPPVYSLDGKHWRHVERFDYDGVEPRLRLHVPSRGGRVWIAHVEPYTNAHLDVLRRAAAKHPYFRETAIGKTVKGRNLLLFTITDPQTPDPAKKVIWLMFRQHSWETGSSWAGEGAVRFLLSRAGAELRRRAVWKILPLCDPDGVARGGVRFNEYGYDLNRNWDRIDPAKMPEIAAERAAIGGRIDFFLSLHNTETSEYLEGPPEGSRELGARFAAELEKLPQFAASGPVRFAEPTTTAGMPGRMTVVQGLWRDLGAPAFLIEQRIARHPKLGRLPTAADRRTFGAALPAAIARAVDPAGR